MEIFEILKKLNACKSRVGMVQEFQVHEDNLALRFILQGAYDDRVSSYLPEGAPPFTPFSSSEGKLPVSLEYEEKTIYNFFRFTAGEKEPIIKQEREFIQLLESIHPEDADVLIRMKDKTLHQKYKRLNKSAVKELLAPWVPDLV
jgi:hypothetical protein